MNKRADINHDGNWDGNNYLKLLLLPKTWTRTAAHTCSVHYLYLKTIWYSVYVWLCICICMSVSVCLPACLAVCLFVLLSGCLFVCLSVLNLYVCMYVRVHICARAREGERERESGYTGTRPFLSIFMCFTCKSRYGCMYVCMYVDRHVYACIHICMQAVFRHSGFHCTPQGLEAGRFQ